MDSLTPIDVPEHPTTVEVAPVADPAVPARIRARSAPDPVQPVAPAKPGKTEKPAEGSLAAAMVSIAKLHGPNVIRMATEAITTFRHVSTGIFVLDMALLGGIPESLITEAIGWESSGKTTVAMRTIASAQRRNPDMRAVFIDVEGTFDPLWSMAHGVDYDKLVLVQPTHGEQAIDILDSVIRANDVSIVALDSLPALMTIKEIDKSAEDVVVAQQARLIGNAVRKATQALLDERKKGHSPVVLLINQWRSRIIMMGDPRQRPGGNALRFFKAVAFEMKNKEVLGKDERDIEVADYNEHSFKIDKNKVGNSIKQGEFTMVRNPSHPMGQGYVDEAATIITFARKFDIVSGGGSSWRFDDQDTRFGSLKELCNHLYEFPDYEAQLRHRMLCMQREAMGKSPTGWE